MNTHLTKLSAPRSFKPKPSADSKTRSGKEMPRTVGYHSPGPTSRPRIFTNSHIAKRRTHGYAVNITAGIGFHTKDLLFRPATSLAGHFFRSSSQLYASLWTILRRALPSFPAAPVATDHPAPSEPPQRLQMTAPALPRALNKGLTPPCPSPPPVAPF